MTDAQAKKRIRFMSTEDLVMFHNLAKRKGGNSKCQMIVDELERRAMGLGYGKEKMAAFHKVIAAGYSPPRILSLRSEVSPRVSLK